MPNKYVSYCSNADGYSVIVVEVDGGIIEDYHAGNSQHDSQCWVEPGSPHAVSPAQLKQFARKTALEMADEHHIPHDCVGHAPDLNEEDE